MSSAATRSVLPLLRLAAPLVLARRSQSGITVAAALPVQPLGPRATAATATGGLNVMGFVILAMGTVFIVQSFVAQLVGRGERDQAPRFAWYGLAIALVSGVIALAMVPLIGPALAHTSYSPEVRDRMTDYMAIRMTSVAAVIGVECAMPTQKTKHVMKTAQYTGWA